MLLTKLKLFGASRYDKGAIFHAALPGLKFTKTFAKLFGDSYVINTLHTCDDPSCNSHERDFSRGGSRADQR